PGEQFAQADLPDLVSPQAQRPPGRVEVGLGVQHHPGALAQARRAQVEHVAVGRHGQADVGRRVTQGEEDGAGARAAGDLRHLSVHPDPAEPGDPRAEFLAHHPDRPRLLGGAGLGLGRLAHAGQPRRPLRWCPGTRPPRRQCTRPPHGGRARPFSSSANRGDIFPPAASPYHRRMTASADPRKRVLLAKPRGYCAGVDRAVQTVEEALALYGPPVYVRKEIVHNRHVVDTLRAKGAIFVEETDEVPEGSIVIFSAHGVAPEVHEQARARRLKAIDATCPLVTKVHQEARRYAAEDYDILLIGHAGHEEVVGTTGEAPDHIQLVDGPDAVDQVKVRDPAKVVWLSQTTLSVDETIQTVERLRAKLPLLQSPPSDDICYATSNRQYVVNQLAPECDVVIVVGSQISSDSQRLREVALDAGARASHLVVFAHQISEDWLADATSVGVTSGASVPDELVMDVLAWLAERGFTDVTEVTTANERLTFSLPQELKRDMKAAAARRG